MAAGHDVGLEVVSWAAVAEQGELGAALAPFVERTISAPEAVLEAWRANGLRVVAVPLGELNALRERLGAAGAVERNWLGQTGRWTEVFRGVERAGGQVIALDAERLRLGPGRLRVLARAWLTPVPPTDAAMTGSAEATLTVEVVAQHREVRGDRELLEPRTEAERPQDAGLLFSRLLLRLRVDARDDQAFVIVAERPGVEWAATQAAPDQEPAEDRAAPERPGVGEVVRGRAELPRGSAEAAPVDGGVGPAVPLVPTLGEALLNPGGASGARAVLVLVPRVPREYRLLPAGR